MPICCLAWLPRAVKVAKEHGYALTVHGSLARDYDFVAVPWTENADEPSELADALLRACGGFIAPHEAKDVPIHKPHGRLCWPIHLGAGQYIDLSVMQPNPHYPNR